MILIYLFTSSSKRYIPESTSVTTIPIELDGYSESSHPSRSPRARSVPELSRADHSQPRQQAEDLPALQLVKVLVQHRPHLIHSLAGPFHSLRHGRPPLLFNLPGPLRILHVRGVSSNGLLLPVSVTVGRNMGLTRLEGLLPGRHHFRGASDASLWQFPISSHSTSSDLAISTKT